MKEINSNPLMIPKEEMDRLKALIGRAAQRIEDIRYADREEGDLELIAELRKAAPVNLPKMDNPFEAEIKRLKAEVERMTDQAIHFRDMAEKQGYLLTRAADALGDYHGLYQEGLIAELRKAALEP